MTENKTRGKESSCIISFDAIEKSKPSRLFSCIGNDLNFLERVIQPEKTVINLLDLEISTNNHVTVMPQASQLSDDNEAFLVYFHFLEHLSNNQE